jgi:hypothetical protein
MLPPDVSESEFAQALQKFEAIVGKEWVFRSED